MASLTKPSSNIPSRRQFLALCAAGVAATALSACSGGSRVASLQAKRMEAIPRDVQRMYAAMPQERFPIPAVNLLRLAPRYWRQVVDDPTGEQPGTVVVDTGQRFLYHVQGNGKATRYGCGIGREGFAWSGRGYIGRKQEWPTWTPPAEMIGRQPELEQYRNGMPPGLQNPLGARALYIYVDGRDTLYRLHGNPDETSIGRAVSSGCVRLLHQDVIDLYGRVPVGSNVVVV